VKDQFWWALAKGLFFPHKYLATACRHGLHDQCRKTCKFCMEPCRCKCHKVERGHQGWKGKLRLRPI
jgi:hypothetical protein